MEYFLFNLSLNRSISEWPMYPHLAFTKNEVYHTFNHSEMRLFRDSKCVATGNTEKVLHDNGLKSG